MSPWEFANIVIPLAGMATGVVVIVTLGRTVRHWVDTHYGRKGLSGSNETRADVARLEERVAGLEEVADRVTELEERLDFAERVLSQQRDRDRLAPGA